MPAYRELLSQGRERLKAEGIDDWEMDAWLLMEHVFGITRSEYFLAGQEDVKEEKRKEYEALLEKRVQHIPLQHLTGEAWFYGLSFYVNDQVLIPRQDTEVLVDAVLSYLKEKKDAPAILDMCTGSGCILLSLLHERTDAQGFGVDLSKGALEVAECNAKRLGIHAEFICSDLFEKLDGIYDVIVSNPPYIESEVIKGLMPEVKEHEPLMALDGKEDGLYFYRKIVEQANRYLKPGGLLAFEIGYNQGKTVSDMMIKAGWKHTEIRKDLAGLDRVVFGTKKQEEDYV